jgi:HK97 family phage prohead protease
MSELLIQRATPALEPVGDGWTVYGRAVPYEVEQMVTDDGTIYYAESFTRGAFARDVAKGGRWVNLMLGHHGDDGERYLGRCVALEEKADGLYPSFRIDREHPSAEAARSGELTGWSVSARVYRSFASRRADGTRAVRREACGISHVAATARPQYAGAGVLVAREHVVIEGGSQTPRLDELRKWRQGLRS